MCHLVCLHSCNLIHVTLNHKNLNSIITHMEQHLPEIPCAGLVNNRAGANNKLDIAI